ncbi:MAG: response regulator [Chlorobiota bacterium]
MDDDKWLQKLARNMLEKYGFTVKEALSPHEGLELVMGEDPMLVLLDLNMPNVSGEALLHLINNMEKTKDTKVVILSAQITKENIKSTYLNGAVGFIAKPFEEKVLIEKINEVLDKESLRKLKKDPKIKEEFFLKI